VARSARGHRDGVDGDETDDGEGEEIGINGEKTGGLEFAVRSEFVVRKLFSCPFYFFLHEKKFLHSGQFLGICWSCENSTDVIDREPRLPRWS
jgi:hypothetical protein